MSSTDFRSDEEMLDIVQRRAAQLGRQARTRRRVFGAVAAVALLGLIGGAVALSQDDGTPPVAAPGTTIVETPATTDSPVTTPIPAGWSPMADSPLSGRTNPITAWTGEEMLIFGGEGAFSDACTVDEGFTVCGEPARNDGAAYNPTTDSWRMMARSPFPDERGSTSNRRGVWAGDELVVWDGSADAGAAYDPVTDSWRELDDPPVETLGAPVGMVWTGAEVIALWSDREAGAAYDPETNAWHTIAARSFDTHESGRVVWGTEGRDAMVLYAFAPQAAEAYDPVSDTWHSVAPPEFELTNVVWGAGHVLAIGPENAATYDPRAFAWSPIRFALPTVTSVSSSLVVGSSEQFFVLFTEGMLGVPREEAEIYAFTVRPGSSTSGLSPERFDPPPLEPRSGMAAVWTGDELLVWGGAYFTGFVSEPYADGARYRP